MSFKEVCCFVLLVNCHWLPVSRLLLPRHFAPRHFEFEHVVNWPNVVRLANCQLITISPRPPSAPLRVTSFDFAQAHCFDPEDPSKLLVTPTALGTHKLNQRAILSTVYCLLSTYSGSTSPFDFLPAGRQALRAFDSAQGLRLRSG